MVSVVLWLAAFAFYLLFSGTVSSLHEMATAGVAASLAAVWAHAAREISDERFTASTQHMARIFHALAGLLPATAHACTILIKASATGGSIGRAIRVRFESGAPLDPAERSRRALAVLAASLAPPRFVVEFERGRAEVILHTIEKIETPPDPDWLI